MMTPYPDFLKQVKPVSLFNVFYIYCAGLGYWNTRGEFVKDPRQATPYTDQRLLNADASDLRHSVFTGGEISILRVKSVVVSLSHSDLIVPSTREGLHARR